MFKSSDAKTVAHYLAAVPADRKELMNFLHEFIQVSAPALKPHFASNMLGYGSFPYKNYKKENIEWPVIALANQKNYVSLYVCAVDHGTYIAEKFAKELGKVSVGKSCIRFKKIEDVHLPTLKKVIAFAATHPGLDGVGASRKET
ncbi:DUF1801 domain-containing protein [Patescibacteria group bacterium]|nr:DUF1801 domain-containing protein [Patescibacteria group bacterium]MBP9710500.1 DUF1801 domain-containing protein [Patescibacteria group bacterium]